MQDLVYGVNFLNINDMKLTIIEWVMLILGYGYVTNSKSKEIHRLRHKHVSCHLKEMKHKSYITRKKALELINMQGSKWNGCRWCWESRDTG